MDVYKHFVCNDCYCLDRTSKQQTNFFLHYPHLEREKLDNVIKNINNI